MKIKQIIWFTIVLGIVSLSLCQDMSITYYETTKPGQIDPVYGAQTSVGRRIVSLLFTPVYGLNSSMVLVPYMATDYPEVNGNSLSFTLKKNMYWHDGKRVITQDVVNSFLMLKREDKFIKKSFLKGFSQFSTSGNNVVTMLLDSPESYDVYDLQISMLPSHHFPTGKITPNSNFTSFKPIGNGPFYLEENTTTKIIFKRFDDFKNVINGEHTNIEEIRLKVERDASQWAQDMIIGRVDVIPSLPTILKHELDGLEGIQLSAYANYSVEMIGFNLKNQLLKELFIRQAFYYAVNREEMIDAELMGNGNLITGPYPAGSEYYWTEYPPYPYDPEKARNLLRERCTEGENGIFSYQGKRLSFRIIGVKGNPKFKNQHTSFKKQMLRVGIEIKNAVPLDIDGFKQTLQNRDFDLVWISWKFDQALDISSVYKTGGTNNFFGYSNTRADIKFKELKIAKDRFIKKGLGYDIHKELHNDPPGLFLWTEDRYAAFNKRRISNFKIHPNDFFYLVHEWKLHEE